MSSPVRLPFGVLCIRADSGTVMGTGHVMRCLAMAQAWMDRGGRVLWVIGPEASPLLDRLVVERVDVVQLSFVPGSMADAAETCRLAGESGAEWLVLDGYHFNLEYRARIKNGGCQLLVMDDLATEDLAGTDLIVNQNAHASVEKYGTRAGSARMLLGTKYALLRREFLPWSRIERRFPSEVRRVLITFGGADSGNVTIQAMRMLGGIKLVRLHVVIVAGALNPHQVAIRRELPALQVHHDAELMVNPSNLPELLARADLVLSAGGGTCWEIACLGVPAVLVVLADNQKDLAARLAALGAAMVLEGGTGGFTPLDHQRVQRLLISCSDRRKLSVAARQLVDGSGAARVVETMAGFPLDLRSAETADAHLLWLWANDPVTREASFRSGVIPWEEHLEWYQSRLEAPEKTIFYVATMRRDPVGVLRFDLDDGVATISVTLAPDARGRGWGSRLIRLGSVRALDAQFCSEIRGWVKATNLPSLLAFQRAGFRQHASGLKERIASVEFRLNADDIAPLLTARYFPR